MTFLCSLLETYIAYLGLLRNAAKPNLQAMKEECLKIISMARMQDDSRRALLNSICMLDGLLTYNGYFADNKDIILLLKLLHQHSPDFIQDPELRDHYKGHPRLLKIVTELEGNQEESFIADAQVVSHLIPRPRA